MCKQHLADGSALALPDTFCPSKVPSDQQPCARQDCPPQWVTGVWSQVDFLFILRQGTCGGINSSTESSIYPQIYIFYLSIYLKILKYHLHRS